MEVVISSIFSKLILHDSLADKTQWYEDEQVEINMYLRQKEQSSVLSLKRTNHALPGAAYYSHYCTFCSTLMGLISIGGNCSRSLKSIVNNSIRHMLQEKIINHMLDHTGPIRIDSVPVDLK